MLLCSQPDVNRQVFDLEFKHSRLIHLLLELISRDILLRRQQHPAGTLLAMVALSAVQSSAQTFIHNAILFIDTFNNAWYNQVHWLIGMPYFPIIASNGSVNSYSRYNYIYIRDTALCWNFSSIPKDAPDIHQFPIGHVAKSHLLLENLWISEPSIGVLEKFQHSLALWNIKCNCTVLFLSQLHLLFIYATKYVYILS